MNSKDKLFDIKKHPNIFEFNEDVANVFNDMLVRSIPFYNEVQKMFIELVVQFVRPNTNIYDLGCSNGNTLILLAKYIKDPTIKIIGIDNSIAMLNKASQNIVDTIGEDKRISLFEEGLDREVFMENASIVLMNWTLQFVRPPNRNKLLRNIYLSLLKNGILILSEKVLCQSNVFNKLYINLYYDYKKTKKYSELEIARKREALENILIPYEVEEDICLLNESGFSLVDIFFKWYNFVSFVCIK